jgi:hypothetical protein
MSHYGRLKFLRHTRVIGLTFGEGAMLGFVLCCHWCFSRMVPVSPEGYVSMNLPLVNRILC